MEADNLYVQTFTPTPPVFIDVRPREQFLVGHIEGSIHVPDSDTSGIMRQVREKPNAILICDDGRMSSNIVRMMGVCGFPEVAYLKGGLRAWTAAGYPLMETTRTGVERRAGTPFARESSSPAARVVESLSPTMLFLGLGGAAALLAAIALFLCMR